jgi:hypothetical protein
MSLLKKGVFARHETFAIRNGWLRKGFLYANNEQNFSDENATVEMGVGKNMVKSIAYWTEAFKILTRNNSGYVATDLGNYIFASEGYDPYLEDPASLWLLHYELACNAEIATTTYWAFNHFNLSEFNAESFTSELLFFCQSQNIRVSENSLKKDYSVFHRMYSSSSHVSDIDKHNIIESPFLKLKLVTNTGYNSQFRFNFGEKKTLPKEFVAYAILNQILKKDNIFSVSFDEILHAPFGAGTIFKINTEDMYLYISKIIESGLIKDCDYTESAGMNILRINPENKYEPLDLLKAYYEGVI